MHRESWYVVIMSLLLIGIGFFFGQYYAVSRGMLWQTSELVCNCPDFPVLTPDRNDENESSVPGYVSIAPKVKSHSIIEEEVEPTFPSQVGAYYLDRVVSGREAMEYSQRIFGMEALVEKVFIPHYSSTDSHLVIWVFEMDAALEARICLEKINNHLEESDTFERCRSFSLQNVKVYYANGLDYNNYYYRKNNIIYWFSFTIDDPIPLFLEFYEYF